MVVEVEVFGKQLPDVVTAEATTSQDAHAAAGQCAVLPQLLHAVEGVRGAARGEQVAATGLKQGLKGLLGLLALVKRPVEAPGVLIGGLRQLFEGKLVEPVVRQQRPEHKTVGPSALEVADLLLHALDFGVGVHKIASATANHNIYGLCYLLS